MILSLHGVAPLVDPSAWVAPSASVIGDVHIGAGSSSWFPAVVRGDDQPIRIGARTNVQDGTIVHITADNGPTHIGDDVTIGHGAIIHACTLHDWAFVGMGAVVLDGAVIERGGMLAAGALLTPNKRIGPHQLWAGSPARMLRVMDEAEQAFFAQNAPHYATLAARFKAGLLDISHTSV